MTDTRLPVPARQTGVMSIDELKAFLASSDVLTFKGNSREENYAWIERTLRTYSYFSRPRSEKGLIRSYIQKITGISASQLTRLINQFRRTRHVRVYTYKRHCFPTKYTREDQLLLAEVDDAHERLSGKATASIDSHTEQLIQESLNKIMKGRTSIVITHRLSTIREADKIIVLHKGKVVEEGTHQQLLALDGLYAALYTLQFA